MSLSSPRPRIPPTRSPGVASEGTTITKGIATLAWEGTTTAEWARRIQAPIPSIGSIRRRSERPPPGSVEGVGGVEVEAERRCGDVRDRDRVVDGLPRGQLRCEHDPGRPPGQGGGVDGPGSVAGRSRRGEGGHRQPGDQDEGSKNPLPWSATRTHAEMMTDERGRCATSPRRRRWPRTVRRRPTLPTRITLKILSPSISTNTVWTTISHHKTSYIRCGII